MKKIINYLDKHRFILVIGILIIICIIFLGIKTLIFYNHKFKELKCDNDTIEVYCENKNKIILNNSKKALKEFEKENKKEINKLKQDYELPDFNNFTAYFYKVASELDYYNSHEDKLSNFYLAYSNTYDLEKFYYDNIFMYEILYNYKIPSLDLTNNERDIYQNQKFYK